ncbi:hypothetical protein ACFLWU_06570 [Chloroflexota bacterium]
MAETDEKSESRWRRFQEHLCYTDEELEIYRSNPKHVQAMEQGRMFAKNKVVIEVIEAHNCGAGYKAGDKFVIDGGGSLVIDECPPNLCIAAIAALKPLVSRMWQAFYNGSSEVFQDTVRCPDTGVRNAGVGEIVMRIYAVPKDR